MSQLNVDTIKSRTGGAPTLAQGVVVSAAATFSSNVSIAGTLTYEDVTNIDSVGLITARSGIEVTAGGINVTAGVSTFSSDIQVSGIVTAKAGSAVTFTGGLDLSNAVETIGTASTTDLGSGKVVLSLDAKTGTVFEHSITSNGIVGIVSLTNFPNGSVKSSGTTFTIFFTQNSAGTGNTTAATGIGTNITLSPLNGVAIAGTEAKVGSGTTVTLSTTGSDVDIVSFFVRSGSASTVAYVTNNGSFRYG